MGHNGAGKTTTLNAMLGLMPCDGEVRVLGLDPFAHRARLMRQVAFVSDVASLPRFFLVRELLAMLEAVHPGFSTARALDFLADGDVRLGHRVGNLSKGMLAQLHLAIVLAIDARLLVLDEPTLGLDITFRKRFYRRLIDDYMNPGRAILITTHQVDEIEELLTDIMFLRDGRIVLDLPMADLAGRYAQLLARPDAVAEAAVLRPVFAESRFGQHVMIFEGVDRARLAPLGAVSTPSLSDLFLALMQRPPGEAAAPR